MSNYAFLTQKHNFRSMKRSSPEIAHFEGKRTYPKLSQKRTLNNKKLKKFKTAHLRANRKRNVNFSPYTL